MLLENRSKPSLSLSSISNNGSNAQPSSI